MAPDADNDRGGFQRSNMRPAGARPYRDMQRGRVEIAVGGHRHALQFQSGGHAEEQLAVGLRPTVAVQRCRVCRLICSNDWNMVAVGSPGIGS